jgi:Protein of unknown function (DUF3383)
MTLISDLVSVQINVANPPLSVLGFGIPLIMDTFTGPFNTSATPPERVRSYTNLQGLSQDFPAGTKVNALASAMFAQPIVPTVVKVGRQDPTDATHQAALNAIIAADNNWYCLVHTYKSQADIYGSPSGPVSTSIAATIEGLTKIQVIASEEPAVITVGSTDTASLLQSSGYNRTAFMWHYPSGTSDQNLSITVTSAAPAPNLATVTAPNHGFHVGDTVFIGGAATALLNGPQLVTTVASGSFTFNTTAPVGADPNNGVAPPALGITAFARFTGPDAAWVGQQLAQTPGQTQWAYKTLAGVPAAPASLLSESGEQTALGKNANVYPVLTTSAGSGSGITRKGMMASGRFIDVQIGVDWLQVNIASAVATLLTQSTKIPYTDAGVATILSAIDQVLDQGFRNGLLGPLLNRTDGARYLITAPSVASQSPTDRQNRNFPGIQVTCQMAGAILTVAMTVNVQI